jgi:hypothetical protein
LKRIVLLLSLLVLALPTGAVLAQAAPYDIQVTGCEEPGGTFTGTITAHHDGSFWTDLHVIDENHPGPWGQCMGSVADGWTHTVTGMAEGTQFGAYFWVYPGDVRSITLDSSLPACGSGSSGAKPLFDMWLLTGGGKYCILVSETHPSAERQSALCFPGEGWVAEQVLCKGTLYDNDFWKCDVHGKERLHVDDLMRYYERHKIEVDDEPPAAPADPR